MLEHFAHLRLDGKMRRQRGERVLEYERDVAATDLIQFSARYAEHVAALKLHRAGGTSASRRQTERGQERLTLAGTAFPSMPRHSPLLIESETPFTASTSPSGVSNVTARLEMSSTVSVMRAS